MSPATPEQVARKEVLRHYVLLALRRAGRPLQLREIVEVMNCGLLKGGELYQLLLLLTDLREIHRVPVTPAMWHAMQARGVKSRPQWLYAYGRAPVAPPDDELPLVRLRPEVTARRSLR